jgi:hypothetical protein
VGGEPIAGDGGFDAGAATPLNFPLFLKIPDAASRRTLANGLAAFAMSRHNGAWFRKSPIFHAK